MRNLFTQTLVSVLILTALLLPFGSKSQVMVYSNTGYAVSISVVPVTLIPSSNSCPWGYNYNLGLAYNVVFSGVNIPASLYTLQGTVGCTGGASHFYSLPLSGGLGYLTTNSNQWRGVSDCNSASINSLRCNVVRVRINGPGIPDQTVTVPVLAVLPVKLTEFTASAVNSGVALRWTTATETANRSFTVERSADGQTWQDLQTIAGAGNSNTLLTYNYTDAQPLNGDNYYRLRQTSEDNSITYSETRLVNVAAPANRIVAYPVPLTGDVCQLRGLTDPQQYNYQVISIAGLTLRQGALSSASVNVNGLAKGTYVLKLDHKRTGESIRLTIVRQ
jgi:hypothetical protein